MIEVSGTLVKDQERRQMAVRLGEMLVSAGKISQEQLEEALRYQVIFGGKLGTNLIELGYLDEEEIALFLSEKLGVPYVQPDRLMDIPPDVIRLIPKETAAKYKIIPFSLEKKRLHLVMADPSDLPAIDEISFMTGLTIKPLVAPEVRIILALEKYYGIERDVRYISIIQKVEKTREKEKMETEEVSTTPAEREAGAETMAEKGEEARIRLLESYSPDALYKGLADVRDREEVADLIMEHLGREFDGAAMFIVRENSVAGWRAVRRGKNVKGMEKLLVPLYDDSVLKTVAEGKSYYLGPFPATPMDKKIVGLLGGGETSIVLLIPVLIMGKVVCIIYVNGGNAELAGKVVDLQKVAGKVAMAFEILILKNKILAA